MDARLILVHHPPFTASTEVLVKRTVSDLASAWVNSISIFHFARREIGGGAKPVLWLDLAKRMPRFEVISCVDRFLHAHNSEEKKVWSATKHLPSRVEMEAEFTLSRLGEM